MISEFRQLYGLLDGPTRRKVPVSAFFSMVISIFEMLGLSMIMPFLVVLASPDSAKRFEWVTDALIPYGIISQEEILLFFGVSMAAMFLVKNILVIFVSWWQSKFMAEGESKLSITMVARYNSLPYLDLTSRNSSELIRCAINDVQVSMSSFLLSTLLLVTELLVISGIIFVIFMANAELAVGMVVFFFVVVAVFHTPLRKRLTNLGNGLVHESFHILRAMREGLGAVREMRVLNREHHFLEDYSSHRNALGKIRAQHTFLGSVGRPYLEIMMLLGIAIAAVTLLAGLEVADIVGVVGLVGTAGLRALPSVNRILTLFQQIRIALPSVNNIIAEFKTTEAEMADSEARRAAIELEDAGGDARRGIEVCDLHFTYPDRSLPALNGLDLYVPWGGSVGIVGASGAGKSTLVDIMLGLLVPPQGSVYVDGMNIHKHLSEWRRRIGYVPQSVYLTDDTVRGNIAFGIPDDQVEEEQIKTALRLAHFDEVIAELPQGLDTVIGEGGVKLSGGQRQRIGIARALYHNPDVLIFDEATSALDNVTESRISEMINELSGIKTTIIIAHRLSTIRKCDNIVMLKDGMKRCEGKFSELEQTCPDFEDLINKGGL